MMNGKNNVLRLATLWLAMFWGAAALAAPLFVPSVKWQKQSETEALLTVGFKVAPNSYIYDRQLEVAVIEQNVVLTASGGDKPVKADDEDELVFKKDFQRQYRMQGKMTAPARLEVTFQGCSDGVCMLPETVEFLLLEDGTGTPAAAKENAQAKTTTIPKDGWENTIDNFQELGRATGYMDKDEFLTWAEQAEQGLAPAQDVLQRVFAKYGLLLAALLIIPLGLLLNLTPCVLPMIPINLAIIGAGAQAGGKGRGFRQGGIYGLGMALTYGGLGLLAVLTGGRFGALNSSPWFNLAVAVIFVILALAMFDVLIIDLSRWRGGRGGGQSSGGMGLVGVFVLGAVAAVLGGACVAPVLIWVLLLAADLWSRGNVVGLFLPFLLGVGMALPWPILGAGMAKMPKPGTWMEQVKRAFGVLILLVAAYYAWLAVSLWRPAPDAEPLQDGWHTELSVAMQQAEDDGQMLFLDFWGLTCKSCMAMKATTFKEQEVINKMQPWVKVAIQADDSKNPEVAALLKKFDVKGLPTYVLLQGGTKVKSMEK